MMCIKRIGNCFLSVRWYKKGVLIILPTFVIWKEGFAFVWMRFTIRILFPKFVEKGGKV